MTDLWRQCFLAALTGYSANPVTSENEGIPCDEIAEFAANQADEAVGLIERRWPVPKTTRRHRSLIHGRKVRKPMQKARKK